MCKKNGQTCSQNHSMFLKLDKFCLQNHLETKKSVHRMRIRNGGKNQLWRLTIKKSISSQSCFCGNFEPLFHVSVILKADFEIQQRYLWFCPFFWRDPKEIWQPKKIFCPKNFTFQMCSKIVLKCLGTFLEIAGFQDFKYHIFHFARKGIFGIFFGMMCFTKNRFV